MSYGNRPPKMNNSIKSLELNVYCFDFLSNFSHDSVEVSGLKLLAMRDCATGNDRNSCTAVVTKPVDALVSQQLFPHAPVLAIWLLNIVDSNKNIRGNAVLSS